MIKPMVLTPIGPIKKLILWRSNDSTYSII